MVVGPKKLLIIKKGFFTTSRKDIENTKQSKHFALYMLF